MSNLEGLGLRRPMGYGVAADPRAQLYYNCSLIYKLSVSFYPFLGLRCE